MVGLFNLFQDSSGRQQQGEVPYSQFLTEVDRGDVQSVVIEGNKITGSIRIPVRRLPSSRRMIRNWSSA